MKWGVSKLYSIFKQKGDSTRVNDTNLNLVNDIQTNNPQLYAVSKTQLQAVV